VIEETGSIASSAQQSFAWDALYTPGSQDKAQMKHFERAYAEICNTNKSNNCDHCADPINGDLTLPPFDPPSSTPNNQNEGLLIKKLLDSIRSDEVKSSKFLCSYAHVNKFLF